MFHPFGCALVCCSLLVASVSSSFGQESLPRPDEAEAQIEAALREPAKFDFADQPLSDVVEEVSERHKISIQLDTKALTDAGLGSDTPVTAHAEGISLRSALRLALDQLDLTYVIRDEVLMITSKTEAENSLTIKIYPVRDLVAGESGLRPLLARGNDRQEEFGELLKLIRSTIAPTTWDEVGGPGSAMKFPHSHSLALSQTTEVHEEIAALLAGLRRTREKQQVAARALAQGKEHLPANGLMQVKIYHLGVRPGPLSGGLFAMAEEAERAAGTTDQAAPEQGVSSKSAPAESSAADARSSAATSRPSRLTPPTPGVDSLEKWAEEIAAILPKAVAPETWQPRGIGFVRVAAGSLVIRQTEANHREIALFLDELLPNCVTIRAIVNEASAPLAIPGPQADWPQDAEPQPGAAEAAIENALDAKVDLSFVETPLFGVMDAISQKAGLRIRLDRKALADAGLASDSPVTRRFTRISLRAALHLLLGEMDLTYVIRNEVLMITSKTEAENMLAAKSYPVFDLVVRPSSAPQQGRAVDFQSLQQAISSNIAPTTWDEVGGPGAMTPFTNAGALVISQTTDVHEEIARYLRALRDANAGEK
jgi:hypothetical protein